MDSLTQIVLGAAVGEVLLAKKIGNKAQLLGAIAGTVPDLDVLITAWMDDPVVTLQVHRAYSHSIITHIFLAIPFAALCYRWFKKQIPFMSFYWLWFLGFATHALLDCCTTYGTQFFKPITNYLVGFNNVSIIDPLYTLPFMIMLIICLYKPRESAARFKLAWWAIGYSMFYMGLTLVAKWNAHQHFEKELNRQHLAYHTLSTSPTIFNAALWAGMAYDDSMMYVSEYSVFQTADTARFSAFPRNINAGKGFESEGLNTFLWFSQGKYIMEKEGQDTLNIYITKWGKMGFEKDGLRDCFPFYNQLIKTNDGIKVKVIEPHFTGDEFKEGIQKIFQRIFL